MRTSFARCEPHVSTRGNDIHQSHTLLTDARIPSTDQTQAAAATALRLVRERKQNEEKRVGAEEGSVDGRREAYVATFDAAIATCGDLGSIPGVKELEIEDTMRRARENARKREERLAARRSPPA